MWTPSCVNVIGATIGAGRKLSAKSGPYQYQWQRLEGDVPGDSGRQAGSYDIDATAAPALLAGEYQVRFRIFTQTSAASPGDPESASGWSAWKRSTGRPLPSPTTPDVAKPVLTLSAHYSGGVVQASWARPAEQGGATISNYVLHWGEVGSAYDPSDRISPAISPEVVTGLSPVSHKFQVEVQWYAPGAGQIQTTLSDEATITPTTPAPPSVTVPDPVLSLGGPGEVMVSWGRIIAVNATVDSVSVKWRTTPNYITGLRYDDVFSPVHLRGLPAVTTHVTVEARYRESGGTVSLTATSNEASTTPTAAATIGVDKPKLVALTERTPLTASLYWDQPPTHGGASIAFYTLQWTTAGDFTGSFNETTYTSSPASVYVGSAVNTIFRLHTRYVAPGTTALLESDWSDTLTIRPAGLTLGTPEVREFAPGQAQVSWQPPVVGPDQRIEEYQVEHRVSGSTGAWTSESLSGRWTVHVIEDLDAGSWEVRVVAIIGYGPSQVGATLPDLVSGSETVAITGNALREIDLRNDRSPDRAGLLGSPGRGREGLARRRLRGPVEGPAQPLVGVRHRHRHHRRRERRRRRVPLAALGSDLAHRGAWAPPPRTGSG